MDRKARTESTAGELTAKLMECRDEQKAMGLQRFFKTGKGEYGEGDKFLGIKVPVIRAVIKPFLNRLSYVGIEELLQSEWHEIRFAALVALVYRYEHHREEKEAACRFYLSHTSRINNWDLVDCSAHKILGDYLKDKERDVLFRLTESHSMWERRIALVACHPLIKRGEFAEIKALSLKAMSDPEDLLHKAAGWMLREMGKVDEAELTAYLERYGDAMPSIMRSYARELYAAKRRQKAGGRN